MRVVYTPKHTDTFSCETYTLGTLGGNKVTLSLRGLAMGPTVTFSARWVGLCCFAPWLCCAGAFPTCPAAAPFHLPCTTVPKHIHRRRAGT